MSKSISISNFLWNIENNGVKIDDFNMENIIIYRYAEDHKIELVHGNFDTVYDFIDREYLLDFHVRKVTVCSGKPTEIEIGCRCDCPVLEKVIPLKVCDECEFM